MCRNIRTLFNFDPPATDDEIRAAALQYVRKVSGTTRPSQANEALFERAVEEVTRVTRVLVDGLVTSGVGPIGIMSLAQHLDLRCATQLPAAPAR